MQNKLIKIVIAVFMLFAINLLIPPDMTSTAAVAPTGIMIPLYTYPGDSWSQVVNTKTTYPAVPIAVVINPASGPGHRFDSNYLTGTQQLQNAGVMVLGYIYTNYAKIPLAKVEAQVDAYWNWYHVNGIAFDGMSNVNRYQTYYSTLNSYVKSLGMTFTVGNPGTTVSASYVGTFDALNIYENSRLPSLATIQKATFNGAYGNNNFAMIAFGVSMPDQTYIDAISACVGWVYFTDATIPNPFGTLPTYFINEVQMLNTAISA